MTVGRLCTREVFFARPQETVEEAAGRMLDNNVGSLVIIDEETRPVGILTDRDLAVRVVARDLVAQKTRVEDVMTRQPESVPETLSLEVALERMKGGRRRRLIVVDAEGRLEGIVTLDDMLALLVEEFESIGALLKRQRP
jgi:CBS domain-containing protein